MLHTKLRGYRPAGSGEEDFKGFLPYVGMAAILVMGPASCHQTFISLYLTSIKGRNSVANLRKTKIYNINIDLVNDNVFTKFGLILLIRSQDIEQKPNSDIKQEPLLCCKFAKKNDLQ